MGDRYAGKEKRKFMRFGHTSNLQYKVYPSQEGQLSEGVSKNISSSGILFKAKEALPLGRTLWLGVDIRNLEICREIEKRAAVVDNGLLGKVVRVEEEEDGQYDIGLCFLLKEDQED